MSQAALLTSPLGLTNGATRPRVDTHPQFLFSFGDIGCDLMVRAGQPLDEWQADALELMLAVRADGKWACFEYCEWVARQNGKGGILEARVLTGLLLLGEELILWSAHEYKTAMEAFRRIKKLIRRLGTQLDKDGNLFDVDGIRIKVVNTNGEEAFERLDTGARIKFVARSKGSGKGFSADLIIIDEAFAYTSVQHEALLYTLAAKSMQGNPQIIYTSSPPLSGDTGDVMYALRLRGDPTAPRPDDMPAWEQDPSLGYRDWGLPGELEFLQGIDLDDIANWAATNPGLGIRITHETVARERRASMANPAGFARERIGIWPRQIGAGDGAWQVISKDQWLARKDTTAEMGDPLTLAIDVTPDRTWSAIAAAGPREEGGRVVDVIDHLPGTGWVIKRLKELAERHGPLVVVCSDKALADAAEGAELADGRKLKVIRAGAADMAASAAAMYDAVAGSAPDTWHLGQLDLSEAVAGATKRPIGDGWAWNRRSITVDICPLVAVSLAIWALGTVRLHTQNLTPFAIT